MLAKAISCAIVGLERVLVESRREQRPRALGSTAVMYWVYNLTLGMNHEIMGIGH
jgi:hypothetical protein